MRKLPEGLLEIKEKYWSQLDQAKRRGIPWLFTFETWFEVWTDSGHWHERGRRKGQYVMSRPGDTGPYAPWNVRIVKVEENSTEGNLPGHHEVRRGYQQSAETRSKISSKAKGRKIPPEVIAKRTITVKNNPKLMEANTKRILAQVEKQRGVPRTAEDKQKMREGIARRKARLQEAFL